MENHNSFVFDFSEKKFLGNFEKMYQRDEAGVFDSWNQESMTLFKKIDLAMIEEFNFSSIIDLGCGKGCFTNLLKKRNNSVYGCDISPTAIKLAKNKFKEIDFQVLDLNKPLDLSDYLSRISEKHNGLRLTVCRGTLYYLCNWKEVLEVISKTTDFVLFGLNIPPDTMAFIKTKAEFIEEFSKNFVIIEHIGYEERHSFSILGAIKHTNLK